PDIEAERKKRDEIEAGKSYCSRRFGGATCDDKSAQIYARFDKNDWRIQPASLRYYFRDIGRMVLAAEGRKANDSHADCYQYFCVPEYGTANGRLHFHAVHFMRTLPTGSV